MEDGLPLSHLTGVVFARDGYLWLSSFDGLIRFDGARFTVFNTASNPELPTSRFVEIAEGPDGALWAAAEFDHVVRWRGGSFDVFALPGVRGASIRRLQFGPEGALWITGNQGVFVFRDEKLEPLPGGLRRGVSGGVYWDREGVVWAGTDGRGALRWRDGAFEPVAVSEPPLGRSITEFAEDERGTLYMGTAAGVLAHRGGSLEFVRPEGGEDLFVRALRRISSDSILVASDRGSYDLVDGRLSFRSPAAVHGSTPVHTVRSPGGDLWISLDGNVYRNDRLVFEGDFPVQGLALDAEGSVWIAADGLHRLKPGVFQAYGEPEGSLPNVYGILEDSRQRIWLGSIEGGTALYEGGSFRRFAPDRMPSLPQAFLEDRDGTIWIGRLNYGACRVVDLACSDHIGFLGGHSVKAIYQDRAGNIWFGTDRGVYRDSAGVVTHFGVADGLAHDFVRVIHQTRDGALWFGTNGGGLARWAGGRMEPLTEAHGLPSDLVRAIHEDERGVLWIGTEDGGLARLEFPGVRTGVPPPLAELRITVIDRRHGLHDDGVHAVLDDGHGRFWMSTNRGIFWVLRSELEAFADGAVEKVHSIAYTERDGLRNREANGGVQSPAIVASDGRLWFATQAGVAVVDPSRIHRTEIAFPVRIESLRPEGGAPVPLPALGTAALRLEAGARDFEVAYTALSFLAPENLRFEYRLEGLQERWIDAGNRRTAFFTNVPPGSYVFRVRATRGDGIWREAEPRLELAVAPFFYETAWFRLTLVGALALLGVLGLRAREGWHARRAEALSALVAERTATVEAQAHRLMQLDAAKSRFFANVSHEFRTPLTLTIGPLEDLESGLHGDLSPAVADQVSLSLRSSRRLLRLVNQLMEVAKLEAGAVGLRAAEHDLAAFLADVLQAFEPLAERKRITARLEFRGEPLPVFFDPELMERVITNLLSNAFKFTPAEGTIRIVAGPGPEGWVEVEVQDSGPGIAPDRLPHIFERFYQAGESREEREGGTGIGLSLARELVQMHGGRLEVRSTPGFGATFTVRLPTGSAHFEAEQLADAEGARAVPAAAGSLEEEALVLEPSAADAVGRPDPEEPSPGGSEVDTDDPEAADVPTVLVVEDNPDVAAYVRKHLAPRFRVAEARDGRDALEQARSLLPDVVVSDVMMPRMDGLELVQALRGDRDLAYVPVLLVTARADPKEKVEALGLGAADYITKPFDPAELEARVMNLIDTRQRLRKRLAREALLHPEPVEVESREDRFLQRVRETVERNLPNEAFDVEALARAMNESRSTLYRHMMEACGRSPSDVLRSMRLERAAQLLESGGGSVSEVAYGVGFKSVSHFSRSFRAVYGTPPSRYPEHSGTPERDPHEDPPRRSEAPGP